MKFIKTTLMAAGMIAAANAWAIQGTISTEQDSKTGDIKWHARSKTYTVSIMKGKTPIDIEFKQADVVGIDVPKPQNFDKAVDLVSKGQGAGAIGILQKIVTDYKMIQWDKPAGRYLALAYISAGQAQKAYEMCSEIIRGDASAAWSGDLAFAYWQSLMKLGKSDELEKCLKKAATSGDRQSSAAALVMRGDIIVNDGSESPDSMKKALRDGYLRVALMYQDKECVRERADAMVKAARCFEKLGQSARAERLRAQAKMM